MAQLTSIQIRHRRIRKRVNGTSERPRLCVHFSGKHIYAQVIDDAEGKTLAAASTMEKDFKTKEKDARANQVTAVKVGTLIAKRSRNKNIGKVVFDRGGFIYHGKVKALADAAREGGLEF